MTPPLIGLTAVRAAGDDGRLRDSLSPEYAEAIVQAGGIPVLMPLSTLEVASDLTILRTLYSRLDGILIPGGGDIHPENYGEAPTPTERGISTLRDSVEVHLVRWAYQDDMPLLGICRGHQMMNVALGGSLHHDVRLMQGQNAFVNHDANATFERDRLMHPVYIEPASRLSQALGHDTPFIQVNSMHHQAVNRLSSELVVSSYADDGIVEGIEAPHARFFMGVQWHPEAIVGLMPQMRHLFSAFVAACAHKPQLVTG